MARLGPAFVALLLLDATWACGARSDIEEFDDDVSPPIAARLDATTRDAGANETAPGDVAIVDVSSIDASSVDVPTVDVSIGDVAIVDAKLDVAIDAPFDVSSEADTSVPVPECATAPPVTAAVTLPATTSDEQLALGNEHTCLRIGGEVFCWGENWAGQVGDGTRVPRGRPTPVASLSNAVEISSGPAFDVCGPRGSHTCARLPGGTVKCWGANVEGEGDYTIAHPALTPKTIPGVVNAQRLSAGGYANCAIVGSDAHARCWGTSGVDIGIEGLTGIASGISTAFALKTDGTVWSWSSIMSIGQLQTSKPVQATAIADAVEIAAGWGHQCLRKADGTVWCWGSNFAGQVGDNTTVSYVAVPKRVVGLVHATSITAGTRSACAIDADRYLWCWGANNFGQLGRGFTSAGEALAEIVSGIDDVVEVRAGYWHTCARRSDNSVWCWGRNRSGQVGDGTSFDRSLPVKVFP